MNDPPTRLPDPARRRIEAALPRIRLTAGSFYEARFVGVGLPTKGALVRAGLARERERRSRQDTRDLSNDSTNSGSGILRGNLCRPASPAFRLQGKLPQTGLRRRRPRRFRRAPVSGKRRCPEFPPGTPRAPSGRSCTPAGSPCLRGPGPPGCRLFPAPWGRTGHGR